MIGLTVLRVVEERLIFPRTHSTARLEVVFRQRVLGGLSTVVEALDELRVRVRELKTDRTDTDTNRVQMLLELPAGITAAMVMEALGALESVETVAAG